jgi:hypothetical protein
MPAGKYSFVIEQGSTTTFEIQYKDNTNTPINLSGYGARMQVRSDVNSSTILLTLSSSIQPDGTGLSMSGSNGTTPVQSGSIGLYISAATSSNLSFGEAVYDLEIHSGNTVYRILEGCVKLSKEVTR